MNNETSGAFSHQLGLSSIWLIDETADRDALPSDSRLYPANATAETRLQKLLQAETFDSMILRTIRPEIFDRDILGPARFHQLRERITARLEELHASTADPGMAAELVEAIEILRRRSTEHELSETLRYALLKG
jgi:hypothetical protein